MIENFLGDLVTARAPGEMDDRANDAAEHEAREAELGEDGHVHAVRLRRIRRAEAGGAGDEGGKDHKLFLNLRRKFTSYAYNPAPFSNDASPVEV